MKHIYIRVDGNEIIATGHVMRCLSIAEQLRKEGAEVTFVVADDRPCALIEEKGFEADVLHTIWNDLDKETEHICEYVEVNDVELLLLDSYFVTKEYLQNLSQRTRIIYIDDLNQFIYPVHTVINYGAFVNQELYYTAYQAAGQKTHFLLGGAYVPLREEFMLKPYKVQKFVQNVLITTGGTDQLNVAGHLLNTIIENRELMRLKYHVIAGCFNQNKEALQLLAGKYPNIYIHENVVHMSDWMRRCDVAISAAGTTTYELCACGIPTVCLEIADNQEGAAIWEKYNYMQYAGNAYKDMEACVDNCIKALCMYIDNFELREYRSDHMQTLVDGNGAKRIAKYIANIKDYE